MEKEDVIDPHVWLVGTEISILTPRSEPRQWEPTGTLPTRWGDLKPNTSKESIFNSWMIHYQRLDPLPLCKHTSVVLLDLRNGSNSNGPVSTPTHIICHFYLWFHSFNAITIHVILFFSICPCVSISFYTWLVLPRKEKNLSCIFKSLNSLCINQCS